MKIERVTASKKTKSVTKPKTVIDLGEELPNFSPVSNVDLENRNLWISTNIKDLLAPPIPQNDFSDIKCDKYLVVENEIVSAYR